MWILLAQPQKTTAHVLEVGCLHAKQAALVPGEHEGQGRLELPRLAPPDRSVSHGASVGGAPAQILALHHGAIQVAAGERSSRFLRPQGLKGRFRRRLPARRVWTGHQIPQAQRSSSLRICPRGLCCGALPALIRGQHSRCALDTSEACKTSAVAKGNCALAFLLLRVEEGSMTGAAVEPLHEASARR